MLGFGAGGAGFGMVEAEEVGVAVDEVADLLVGDLEFVGETADGGAATAAVELVEDAVEERIGVGEFGVEDRVLVLGEPAGQRDGGGGHCCGDGERSASASASAASDGGGLVVRREVRAGLAS